MSSYELKSNFGIIDIDKTYKIKRYNEKPSLNVWFNIGYIIINKSVFKDIFRFKKFEFFLKYLVRNSMIKSYKHKGLHITINTIKELEEAKKLVVKFESSIKR